MALEVCTFTIHDDNTEEDQRTVSNFLATVDARRIETAYAPGGWRMLVLFESLRHREEQAQIESVLFQALNRWADRRAGAHGLQSVMSASILREIARSAPTTSLELGEIADRLNVDFGAGGVEIVSTIRDTMDGLNETQAP